MFLSKNESIPPHPPLPGGGRGNGDGEKNAQQIILHSEMLVKGGCLSVKGKINYVNNSTPWELCTKQQFIKSPNKQA